MMKRLILSAALALLLGAAACASEDDDRSAVPDRVVAGITDEPEVPESVIEGVREKHPQTRTDDIAYSYRDAKEQVPDATDEQIIRWMIEALDMNEAVKAWNDCLERNPTGDGCVEANDSIMSDDNPFGW